ncbi:L-2-amino-thiazoline-4-carboxylic acid hydrolase [Bosea sp. NPDC055594]
MSITMPNEVDTDDLVAAMKRLLKVSARMYMHLAKATITRFGREGEMTIRLGLRAYGLWRGTEMRQAHQAMGLEINMKNLIGCWDNASTYIVKDAMEEGGTYLPYDTRFDVHYCPAAEAWQDAEFFQWGHMYCDEFHQACAAAYHPDGNVVIPQNLMKGDDHCHFQWIMPPNAAALPETDPTELGRRLARDYEAYSPVEAAWLSLKRSNRLVGGRFYVHARAIIERHGEAGREVIIEALRAWGSERGRLLAKEHAENGIAPSIESFIREHDLPARFVWNHKASSSPDSAVIEIIDTPQDQAWADLDALDLGQLWYSAAYPAMAEAYLEGLSANWVPPRPTEGAAGRIELKLS